MLSIKVASLDDFDFYYKLKCEYSSVYWSGYNEKPSHDSLKDFWDNIIEENDSNRSIYILFDDNMPVGYVQTVDDGQETELSMGIVEAARGKGYGTEIIRLLIKEKGNRNYYSFVREDNFPSEKCFINNGFKKTEVSRRQYFALDDRVFKMFKYIKKSKVIAIIPARSGSKGLPDKNIRILNGKPLLAYSIEAAINSGVFDKIHVSTDSIYYANIAKKYGADVPFLRDEENAMDVSSSWDVVREVLKKYQKIGWDFDVCVLLQPTSPLRGAVDIKAAYALFQEQNAKSLVSVTEVDHPVQWCFKLDKNHYTVDFATSPFKNCRRQELEKYYRENGAIYIAHTSDIVTQTFDFYTEQCIAYVMKREYSVDIDTLRDFVIAEALMEIHLEEKE